VQSNIYEDGTNFHEIFAIINQKIWAKIIRPIGTTKTSSFIKIQEVTLNSLITHRMIQKQYGNTMQWFIDHKQLSIIFLGHAYVCIRTWSISLWSVQLYMCLNGKRFQTVWYLPLSISEMSIIKNFILIVTTKHPWSLPWVIIDFHLDYYHQATE